jgi:hypothetical protein
MDFFQIMMLFRMYYFQSLARRNILLPVMVTLVWRLTNVSAMALDPNSFTSLGANPFTVTGTYTINSAANPPVLTRPGLSSINGVVSGGEAVFTFDNISIPTNVIIQPAYNSGALPVAILSKGDWSIANNSEIDFSGSDGVSFDPVSGNAVENGGAAGPGGGGGGGGAGDEENGYGDGGAGSPNGGNGGAGEAMAFPGNGGSVGPSGGGVGGGGGAFGGVGGNATLGYPGGSAYGNLGVNAGGNNYGTTLQGGSGGGGGGYGYGGGGGGGGGAVEIGAIGNVELSGYVYTFGGSGGTQQGGGGAGGGVYVHGSSVSLTGGIGAYGGVGASYGLYDGGGGGGGRVFIYTSTGQLSGGSMGNVNVSGGSGGNYGGSGTATLAGLPRIMVTNTNDSGPGSLRQAISTPEVGTYITFSNNLAGAAILLTIGEVEITNNLIIDASALPGGITINGNYASRIFSILPGAYVTLAGLILTNASSINIGVGGAIFNSGVLTLTDCLVTGNSSDLNYEGGAIFNQGPLTLTGCTFTGNVAGRQGGAIADQGDLCSLQSCTFNGNTASNGSGGAISETLGATLNILHCTFISNNGPGGGGDIFNNGSHLNITNSILAGSTYADIYSVNSSTNTFVGSNIVQVLDNFGTLVGASTILAVNPQLAPLGNYGGPTPTMPPLPGSPAINAATFTTLATDQRGFPRPVGPAADLGAVEWQAPVTNRPVLANASLSAGGANAFSCTFTNRPVADFTVLASTNLALPLTNWTVLGEAMQVASGQYQFSDPQATNFPVRFYDVRSP